VAQSGRYQVQSDRPRIIVWCLRLATPPVVYVHSLDMKFPERDAKWLAVEKRMCCALFGTYCRFENFFKFIPRTSKSTRTLYENLMTNEADLSVVL
jgi:hypothetical protein